MTVYVDDARIEWRGKPWCHMLSDESFDELHALAKKIGLKRAWFQGDHYDVTESMRLKAIAAGAVGISWRDPDFHRVNMKRRELRKAATDA